jgi:hypothetical protein
MGKVNFMAPAATTVWLISPVSLLT